jgi:hypothetical protein
MIAGALSIPEIAIGQTEADAMAHAVSDVEALYNSKFDPRAYAWVKLASVFGISYMVRYRMYRERKAEEQAEAEKSTVPTVQ